MSFLEQVLGLVHPQPWPVSALRVPQIENHRGYCAPGVKENTLESFRAARSLGSSCCELDVQLSKDLVPIVFHDDDLLRLFGRTELIKNCQAAELRELGIPSLQEVLTDRSLTPFFNIELKSKISSDSLPRRVAQVIQKTNSSHRVFFSSFNPACLYLLEKYCPEIPRALLATNEVSDENKWYLRYLVTAPWLKIHMLNLDQKMLSETVIKILHENGMPFSAWTVNDEKTIHQLLRAGARSVITDLGVVNLSLEN